MKKIVIVSVVAILAACSANEHSEEQRVQINVQCSMNLTRGIQETTIANNEIVYVWAFEEENAGTTDWISQPYLKAWTLTADGNNGLIGNKRYYPSKSLSMVAIHGNFIYSENNDAFPASVSHTIENNQNAIGNYEKSDLLYWKGQNKTAASNPINMDFTHKLSKIEISLESDYYSDAELCNAVVRLNNVIPTVTMTLSTGTLESATGSATKITARRVDGNPSYEAVIPPQTAPSNFISVLFNGKTITSEVEVGSFSTGEKYVYKIKIKNIQYPLPLEYIATGNIKNISKNAQGKWIIDTENTSTSSAYFTWAYFSTNFPQGSACDDGHSYHSGSRGEWLSIFPSVPSTSGSSDPSTNWGESVTQKTENNIEIAGITGQTFSSYWYQVSSTDIIGIRYISSTNTNYCSAWRYTFSAAKTTIKAKRLSTPITAVSQVSNTNNAIWTEIKRDEFWETDVVVRYFPSCGWQSSGSSNLNPTSSGIRDQGSTGLYLINNSVVSSYYDEAVFYYNYGTSYSSNFGNPGGGRSVRLFRDELP